MTIIDYYMNNKNKSLLILHFLILSITSFFFLYFDYFLLCDYPNYLARINLFNHLSDTQNILSEYYYKNFQITPYMAFPVIVSFLEPFVGIYLAGKLFIVLAISVIISGGVFLNYTLYNRITAFSLLLHIFIFNFTLSMGFMNFTLVLGLVLWGFAVWLRYNNTTFKFYALFATYSIVVFFCHVFGLFLLGLLIGLHHLSLQPITSVKGFFTESAKATLKVLTFTAIPMIIALCISSSKNSIGFPSYTDYVFPANILLDYITPLMFNTIFGGLLFISFFIILIFLKKFDFKQPFIIVCLVIISFLVPFWVLGVAFVNIRIPTLVGLLFATSTTLKGEKRQIIFYSVITGIFSIYFYMNNVQMLYQQDLQVREFIKTIKSDPNLNGKRLLTVNDKLITEYPWGHHMQYAHFSSYAVLEANMFVPEMITYIPPISLYRQYTPLSAGVGVPIFSSELRLSASDAEKYIPEEGYEKIIYWKHWRQDFDYVLWIHFKPKPKNVPAELEPYKQGSFFTLYKIEK